MGLAGNIERPGSMITWVLPETGLIEDFIFEYPITDDMKSKIIGGDKYKMGAARTCNPDTMVKAINSGNSPIRVWFSVGGQQIVHMANTKEVVEAIEKVEFMSHTDLFMGPMAEAADIVLPAAHWLELDDVYDMHPRFMIEAHNKVVDPPGEAQADAWIFNEVGRRVYPEKWFPTVREMLDHEVRKGKNGKMTWDDFSENLVSGCYGPDQVYYKYKTDYWHEGGGFPTPSKKFEFKSQHLESLGYDGLPVFTEPGESPVSTPELYKEYPLLLSTGFRQPFYFLGQYRNIPWLRSYMEFPQCQMHPETAKEYGVEDGDIIWIETKRGRIRQKLHEFAGIKKGMVMATANWFYPEEPAKGYHGVFISNPNVLTSNDHLDPMYGSPDMTCLICKVYRDDRRGPRGRRVPERQLRHGADVRRTLRRPADSRPAADPPDAAGRSTYGGRWRGDRGSRRGWRRRRRQTLSGDAGGLERARDEVAHAVARASRPRPRRARGIALGDRRDDLLVSGEHLVLGAVEDLLVDGQEEVGAHGVHRQREPGAVRCRGDAAVDPGVGLEQGRAPAAAALLLERTLHGLQVALGAALGRELREPPLDGDAELEDVVQLAAVLGHPLLPAALQGLEVAHS